MNEYYQKIAPEVKNDDLKWVVKVQTELNCTKVNADPITSLILYWFHG